MRVTSNNESSFCSIVLVTYGIISVPSHSNRCLMVYNYYLNLHFLMRYYVDYLFICLFAVSRSSSVKCLLRILTFFIIGLFVSYYWVLRVHCKFWIIVFSPNMLCYYFFLVCSFSSHYLENLNKVWWLFLLFLWLIHLVLYLKMSFSVGEIDQQSEAHAFPAEDLDLISSTVWSSKKYYTDSQTLKWKSHNYMRSKWAKIYNN